jgi:hypothetical protein
VKMSRKDTQAPAKDSLALKFDFAMSLAVG